jgi:hypothetical protein
MYDDFKSLNFWKTTRKLDRIETLISRMRADAITKSNRIDSLINSIKIISNKLNDTTQFVNPFIPTVPALSYLYADDTDRRHGEPYNYILADVYIDGIFSGHTREMIPVLTGFHYIELICVVDTTPVNVISSYIEITSGLNSVMYGFIPQYVPEMGNIIVHGHNPEGKEIGSITGFSSSVAVYDGANAIGFADGINPITILSGHHYISVKFNGITLNSQEIDIVDGETKNLTFTFNRTSSSVGSFTLFHTYPSYFDYRCNNISLPPNGFNAYFLQIKAFDCSYPVANNPWAVGSDLVSGIIIGQPSSTYFSYWKETLNQSIFDSSTYFFLQCVVPNIPIPSTLPTWERIECSSIPYDPSDL